MSTVITTNPEILSGAPVFKGTRVPVKNLFDYIEGGHPLDDFLEDFPSVTKSQVETLFQELDEDLKNAA